LLPFAEGEPVSGASIEAALELWASSLRDAKARMRPLFTQERVAASAGRFLDGLLGPERRKTGWMRAEAAGDPGPWRQQAILGRGRWEADALRDIVRDYALETLADPDAVLVVDETGFLKQGKASCGVGRQYTGSAGKITNCRIGVFAGLRVAARARPHRPRTLPAEGLDRRPGPPGGGARAARGRLRHQAALGRAHGRARDRGRGAVPLGGGRRRLRAWAKSRWRCAGRARATCSGSTPRSLSTPGSASPRSPAPPSGSRKVSQP
jgi:hypothetical protein